MSSRPEYVDVGPYVTVTSSGARIVDVEAMLNDEKVKRELEELKARLAELV